MKGNRILGLEMLSEQTAKILMIACGNLSVAVGVTVFIKPSGLISGGATGVALLLNRLFGIQVSTAVLIINIVMFIFGLKMLGKKFALGTLLSSVLYPLFLYLLEQVYIPSTDSVAPIIAVIFGGLMVGLGVGTVFRAGASTGGMDPVPLTLHKYLNVPLGIAVYGTDCVIVLLQAVFSRPLNVFYGVLFVVVSSLVVGMASKEGQTGTAIGAGQSAN